jgi:pyruvate formate lyase activating enzyme
MKKEYVLFERLGGKRVRCTVCRRRCEIAEGGRGWCRTRINEGGTCYTLIYGKVSSICVNPIEKKPVYHFFPGSRWLSLGSLGCNFRCPGCQNWDIAHWTGKGLRDTNYIEPEKAVDLAESSGCLGISWTFNEPTIWLEYTIDSAVLAKECGLHTNYVTNGFISGEAFDLIAPWLDVWRVDVKGFSERSYEKTGHTRGLSFVLENTVRAKKRGMHVEVVTNITPGFNDDEGELRALAAWIRDALGPETPWHVTRFHPHHRLQDLHATSLSRLEEARQIGKEEGLWYVYLGNVPGHRWENTYCHRCGELLIRRFVFDIQEYRLQDGLCPSCGIAVPGVFGLVKG